MFVLLISLLLFSAFSQVYPSTNNSPYTTQENLPWQENTKKLNSIADALKRCICWPDNVPITVHQQLDAQNNGQERLVIYLYKNDVTNEIKMYTPNANKQMLIPDIPYEAGDGLVTVTTENVFSLLYNNPNKIKVYNDHIEKVIPAVTESLAIGLNTGAIESFYANADSYLLPNNTYNGNEYSYTKPVIANEPTADIVNEPLIAIPESYDTNNSNHTPEQYWMANNYPYTNPNLEAIPLDPQTTADNNQPIQEDHLATPASLQSYQYKLTVNPISSQFLLPELQVIPDNSQDHTTVNPQIIPDSIKVVPGAYVGSLDQNNVYTFQTSQEKNILQPGLQDINNPLTDRNVLTFNIWFNQQMKRFQNVHLPSDIKTIDSDSLKLLVQKTFLENNIYIGTDGEITDAKGIVIDASNIELRPLLLGEKVNHQILRNTKVIKLPKHLPYLEGILVTLVSPPQILGIIPLGKTYLPETSYSTQSLRGLTSVINGSKIYINGLGNPNVASYVTSGKGPYTLAYKDIHAGPTKYYAYSEVNGVPLAGNANLETYGKVLPVNNSYGNKKPQLSEHAYWSSGPYYTASKLPNPTANWNPSELEGHWGQRRKNPDAVIQHHIEQPLKTRKKGKGRKQLTTSDNLKGNISEGVTTPEPFLEINTTDSVKRYPGTSLSSMMQTLLHLLDDLPSRRGINSTDGADIVNESESNNDGGSPDFRIIGGNPATGSGTPLSNKGRSGVEFA